MSRLSAHHTSLTNGIGKCSVPMWSGGAPAGFCDSPAYGQEIREPLYRNAYTGEERTITGRMPSYAPGLACPGHGGPSLIVQRDGDAWFAALPGFTNIQECETGWVDTAEQAVEALHANLGQEPRA